MLSRFLNGAAEAGLVSQSWGVRQVVGVKCSTCVTRTSRSPFHFFHFPL
jgi:hypothetical protein